MTAASAASLTGHGVFLEVEGLGVYLRGASGVGKSELGLELVSRGHKLIADDAIEFIRADSSVVGRCPALLEGFIEVRGLGILNVRRVFGDAAVVPSAALDLIIDLGVRGDPTPDERLYGRRGRSLMLGIAIDEISLPRRVGHNLAVLVEAACRDHRLRQAGYNACDDLVARQARAMQHAAETPHQTDTSSEHT